MKSSYPRYNPTDNSGRSILETCINKEIGWIARPTNYSDLGIDMMMEQVKDGNGTARYISIQLKSGLGNVSIKKDGNFDFYFTQVHYDYWLSSSIPVIFVLCDVDNEILYWQQIKMSRISKTPKGYKLTINKNHQLDKRSLPELNSIIEAYQSTFSIPEDYEDGKDDIEYWADLLDCSKDAIQNATQTLERIHEKYEEAIKKAKINIEKGIRPEKNARQLAQKLILTLNIGKTHFSAHILTISHTFIEAIRLSERALLDISCVSFEIATYIKKLLRELNITIAKTIEDFDEGVYKFSQHTGYNADLDRTENSFGLILEDYTANLKSINSIITKLLKDLDNAHINNGGN